MSISILTTHIYSAIVYLHNGTCGTFHNLTSDNICSFFFGNPKLLEPVLDGRLVYTHLLVGYPIMKKDRSFFKVWVYASQIWIVDWSTFSNHVVEITTRKTLNQRTHAKSIRWQVIDIVDMISIIMFHMTTHDFACRQEHYIFRMFTPVNPCGYSCVSDAGPGAEAGPEPKHTTAALHVAGPSHKPHVPADEEGDGLVSWETGAGSKWSRRLEVHPGQVQWASPRRGQRKEKAPWPLANIASGLRDTDSSL